MRDDWRKIERGLFESSDGQWRIANPYKITTELRHRWLVAQRRTTRSGWHLHDGDHATLHDARAYVEAITGHAPAARPHQPGLSAPRTGQRTLARLPVDRRRARRHAPVSAASRRAQPAGLRSRRRVPTP